MTFRVLAINPGSTSTKVAVYDDENLIMSESIAHSSEELSKYKCNMEQLEMRTEAIEKLSTSTKVAVYDDENLIMSESIAHSSEELSKYKCNMEQLEMRTEAIEKLLLEKGIAVYDDENLIMSESIAHSSEELSKYKCNMEQLEMRTEAIEKLLLEKGIDIKSLNAVVGRGGAGGALPPVKSGAYKVNDLMIDTLKNRPVLDHASNLGAVIAKSIADSVGVDSFIYDSISVDEMSDVARISGLKDFERTSMGHALNTRAMALKYAIAKSIADSIGVDSFIYDSISVDEMSDVARISGLKDFERTSMGHALNTRAMALKYAKDKGLDYNSLNLIVAHVGGGATVYLHEHGQMSDMISDDEGPVLRFIFMNMVR